MNTAGTGSIVLTRKYTPTWAIVVAVIGLLLTLVGVAALLYKNTETLTITLSPVPGGTRVTISGIATHEMLTRISSALSAMPALDPETATFKSQAESEGTRTCPECAETVKSAAKVCRFCGHQLQHEPSPAPA